jgi:NhaA family Na+:H+ antiporter
MLTAIKSFFKLESIGGILLVVATILAIIFENTLLNGFYHYLSNLKISFAIDEFNISKPLLLWVNDGLMAIFFFIIGLEVKREVLGGELSHPKNVVLPILAAVGGMVVPAIIYTALNFGDDIAMAGWATPVATDIAFALGVLLLLGDRVPKSLKLFLLTLAIADDIGAILIIAIFYTSEIHFVPLMVVFGSIGALVLLSRFRTTILAPFLIVGVILWVAMLKSGVHATLAGVITALFIPYVKASGYNKTLLEEMEHDLHPIVTFAILPLFAFMNMGIGFEAFTIENLTNNISLGIILGLFFGNQIGVFGVSYLAIKFKFAELPSGSNYLQLYGVSVLCGIGFTMSLFIGSLAFFAEESVDERFAILVGSVISAIYGYLILLFASKKSVQQLS